MAAAPCRDGNPGSSDTDALLPRALLKLGTTTFKSTIAGLRLSATQPGPSSLIPRVSLRV